MKYFPAEESTPRIPKETLRLLQTGMARDNFRIPKSSYPTGAPTGTSWTLIETKATLRNKLEQDGLSPDNVEDFLEHLPESPLTSSGVLTQGKTWRVVARLGTSRDHEHPGLKPVEYHAVYLGEVNL